MADARLPPEALRRRCDPDSLPFQTTAEVEPLDGTVGQPRALDAIGFGLGIETPGYNIYASGPGGTGKRSTLESYLRRQAGDRSTPVPCLSRARAAGCGREARHQE